MAKPIEVQGARAAAILIDRAYREGTDTQFLREMVQNGIEANATKIQIGIHWQSVAAGWRLQETPSDYHHSIPAGKYRLVYYDNGFGMGDRMADYMAGLLDLDSKNQAAGDIHGNFAMGVRVSTLPWNGAGIIVASWTEAYPDGQIMWLRRVDVGSGADSYEAATLSWVDESGGENFTDVAPASAFPEFVGDRPDWLGHALSDGSMQTGTMLLMLGNTGKEDTFLGPREDWKTHTGPNYLAHRYFEFPDGLEIRYEDPRAANLDGWTKRRRDRFNRTTLDGSDANPEDRVFNEPIRSTQLLMRGDFARRALAMEASIPLPRGGRIVVYLLPDSQANSGGGQRAASKPAIGVLYKSELYHRKTAAREYQKFAISHPKVYNRLAIIVEPRQAESVDDPLGGVFPSSARTVLQYVQPSDSSATGRDLPWSEWEQVFIDKMPDFVEAAILSATPEDSDDIDKDVIDRVAQPFMDRFKRSVWIPRESGDAGGKQTGEDARAPVRRRVVRSKGGQSDGQRRPSGESGGEQQGAENNVRAGIPECRFDAEAFSEEERGARPQIGVKYTKGRTGELGTVVIDPHFPLIKEVEAYWKECTPAPQYAEVLRAIHLVYRTEMACRVGQILAVAKQYRMTEDEITRDFMSDSALTASLFGIASEHADIKGRLDRKVRRRSPAGVEDSGYVKRHC